MPPEYRSVHAETRIHYRLPHLSTCLMKSNVNKALIAKPPQAAVAKTLIIVAIVKDDDEIKCYSTLPTEARQLRYDPVPNFQRLHVGADL
jgi:hypothetical protein